MLTIMNRTQRRGVWIAGAGALIIIAVVAAVLVSSHFGRADRNQRYLETLRADETTTVGELPDEQLLMTLDDKCDRIASGWTLDDEMAAAERNREATISEISQTDYNRNTRALYNAAAAVC